jgi:hypothetical protein
MATPILLKKSSVAGKVPLTTDLQYGEVALNYTDNKIYFKDASNNIKAFLQAPTLDDVTDNGATTTNSLTIGGLSIGSAYTLPVVDGSLNYVLSTNEYHTVREFVEKSFALRGFNIKWKGEGINEIGYDENTGRELIVISEKYFRPTEVDLLLGDSTSQFTAPVDSTTTSDKMDSAMLISFRRLFSRDKIKRETFAMKFYKHANVIAKAAHPGNINTVITGSFGSFLPDPKDGILALPENDIDKLFSSYNLFNKMPTERLSPLPMKDLSKAEPIEKYIENKITTENKITNEVNIGGKTELEITLKTPDNNSEKILSLLLSNPELKETVMATINERLSKEYSDKLINVLPG